MPYGVKANIKAPHRFMRMGALCWLMFPNPGGGGDKITIRGLSRSGRKVDTWIDSRDLENYRPGWIEEGNSGLHSFPTKEKAQTYCDGMNAYYGDQPVREHAAKYGSPT